MELTKRYVNADQCLKFDKSVYNHKAILATAYKFTDRFYFHIDSTTDSTYHAVFFSVKESCSDLERETNEFRNELIDQQLRHDLSESNNHIKELIIRKAFFPFDKQDQNE